MTQDAWSHPMPSGGNQPSEQPSAFEDLSLPNIANGVDFGPPRATDSDADFIGRLVLRIHRVARTMRVSDCHTHRNQIYRSGNRSMLRGPRVTHSGAVVTNTPSGLLSLTDYRNGLMTTTPSTSRPWSTSSEYNCLQPSARAEVTTPLSF